MLIEVQTAHGPQKIRVCDYCQCVPLPYGTRFCSGHCSRNFHEREAASVDADRSTKAKGTQS